MQLRQILRGSVARCESGELGVVTNTKLIEIVHPDGFTVFAYPGICLNKGKLGRLWSSPAPRVIGDIPVEILDVLCMSLQEEYPEWYPVAVAIAEVIRGRCPW